jgi:hypothetical protein
VPARELHRAREEGDCGRPGGDLVGSAGVGSEDQRRGGWVGGCCCCGRGFGFVGRRELVEARYEEGGQKGERDAGGGVDGASSVVCPQVRFMSVGGDRVERVVRWGGGRRGAVLWAGAERCVGDGEACAAGEEWNIEARMKGLRCAEENRCLGWWHFEGWRRWGNYW